MIPGVEHELCNLDKLKDSVVQLFEAGGTLDRLTDKGGNDFSDVFYEHMNAEKFHPSDQLFGSLLSVRAGFLKCDSMHKINLSMANHLTQSWEEIENQRLPLLKFGSSFVDAGNLMAVEGAEYETKKVDEDVDEDYDDDMDDTDDESDSDGGFGYLSDVDVSDDEVEPADE